MRSHAIGLLAVWGLALGIAGVAARAQEGRPAAPAKAAPSHSCRRRW